MIQPPHRLGAPSTAPQTRDIGLDVLRILSICGVVAIHVFGLRVGADPKAGKAWWAATVVDIGFIWVVPVFVMISGALVLGSRQLTETPAVFYRRRAVRLVPALVAWNLVYLVGVRIWMRHEHLSTARVLQLLYDGSVFTQLYFLWLILGLYAVAPVLGAFLRAGRAGRPGGTAAAVLAATVLAFMATNIMAHFGVHRPTTLNVFTHWMPYVGYFLAGYALRNVRLKGPALAVVTILTALLASFSIWHYGHRGRLAVLDILVTEHYLGVAVALTSLGVFAVGVSLPAGMQLPDRPARFLVAVSNAAFGVFLVHLVIFEAIRLNWDVVGVEHSVPGLAIAYLATLVASFGISLAAARIPLVRQIF